MLRSGLFLLVTIFSLTVSASLNFSSRPDSDRKNEQQISMMADGPGDFDRENLCFFRCGGSVLGDGFDDVRDYSNLDLTCYENCR